MRHCHSPITGPSPVLLHLQCPILDSNFAELLTDWLLEKANSIIEVSSPCASPMPPSNPLRSAANLSAFSTCHILRKFLQDEVFGRKQIMWNKFPMIMQFVYHKLEAFEKRFFIQEELPIPGNLSRTKHCWHLTTSHLSRKHPECSENLSRRKDSGNKPFTQ